MTEDNKMPENENLESSRIAPTDLRNTDIEMFGQENIPLMNMNRKASITDLGITANNSEFNNIGIVPPGLHAEKEKNRKFNIKQYGFIALIFVIILLIGGGIYFYLSKTRNVAENSVLTKNIEVNIGDKLSLNLNHYADFKNIKATNCILNTKEVNVNKLGTYTYIIKCGINEYKGNISVVDKKAPEVKTKLLFKSPNENLDVSEFILECNDSSECSYELLNFDELKDNMKTNGIYSAEIEVKDKQNNKANVKGNLIVTDNVPDSVLDCSYKELDLKEIKGKYISNEIITLIDSYADSIIIKNKYIIKNKEDYNNLKKQVNENNELTIENVTGNPTFIDSELTIILMNTKKALATDFLGSGEKDDVKEYYDMFGYSCEVY